MESWHIQNDHIFDRRNLNIFKKWWLDIDRTNFLLVVAIIIFGFIMTNISSPAVAEKISTEKLFFVKKQIIFSFLAIFVLTAISFFNSEQIKLTAIIGLFGAIILLIAVLVFGSEAKGAKRWLVIFGFTLQPSEFAKTF
jgi:cell division protein FtsW